MLGSSRENNYHSLHFTPIQARNAQMRLIIDTDTAGDDCFSMLLGMLQGNAVLEAVTICNGNIPFAQQTENALKTIEVAGFAGKVPVYEGCTLPLLRRPVDAAYVFGADGMSDANYSKTAQRPEAQHAVDAMIDLVMRHPGEITIIAQAPLTNIAMAARKEPRFAKAVKHLWIMGGTDNAMGNVTPAAEFNFYVDPEAAAIVLNAGFAASLVTWTLTLAASVMHEKELAEISELDTSLSRFFHQVNSASVAFSLARYGSGATVHPDALTCALALDESLILESEMCRVDVETEGRLTRGYSSVSSGRLPDQEEAAPELGAAMPANIRVIREADRERFRSILVGVLRGDGRGRKA